MNIPVSVSMINNHKNMLFMSKGRTKVEVNLQKNSYMPGDVIHITSNIDNSDSDKSIK